MTEAEAFKAFEGMWGDGEYLVTFSYEDPEGTMDVLIEKDEADGTLSIWDYPACWYDEKEGALICAGVERRRVCVDPETYETAELDWSLDDMQVALFILSEDGETLVGNEIAGLESDLALKRITTWK